MIKTLPVITAPIHGLLCLSLYHGKGQSQSLNAWMDIHVAALERREMKVRIVEGPSDMCAACGPEQCSFGTSSRCHIERVSEWDRVAYELFNQYFPRNPAWAPETEALFSTGDMAAVRAVFAQGGFLPVCKDCSYLNEICMPFAKDQTRGHRGVIGVFGAPASGAVQGVAWNYRL